MCFYIINVTWVNESSFVAIELTVRDALYYKHKTICNVMSCCDVQPAQTFNHIMPFLQ